MNKLRRGRNEERNNITGKEDTRRNKNSQTENPAQTTMGTSLAHDRMIIQHMTMFVESCFQ